jgi:DNA-binding NtrC family response regulator
LSERTLELLSQYAWPGNIRELRNLVERLVLLSRADRIEPMDLPEQIRRAAGDNHPEITLPLDQPLKEAEKQIISSVLSRVTHNRTLAARILGISLRALHYKIKRFGLSSN